MAEDERKQLSEAEEREEEAWRKKKVQRPVADQSKRVCEK
jgi:hypothetical protein